MKQKSMLLALVCLFFILMNNIGCEPSQNQQSDSGAKQMPLSFRIPLNSNGLSVEQQNIYDRLVVTTDPTKILWLHLISLDGKIIHRFVVVSKVTSSGKRLEPRHASGYSESHSYYPSAGNGFSTDEFIQPDGSFGESDSYIFWFDTYHRYHQWGTAGGLGYLLTDYPIDLKNPMDEITGLFNMNIAAYNWQKIQEEKLRESEKVAHDKWQKKMKVKEKDIKENWSKYQKDSARIKDSTKTIKLN